MKTKISILLLFFFVGTVGAYSQYQNIIIQSKDGHQFRNPFVFIEKIYFSEEKLIIDFKGDTIETHSLSTINKIFFKETSSDVKEDTDYANILVYPNPSTNQLFIKDMPDNINQAIIYNIQGEILLTAQVSEVNNSVNISELTNGVYFIRIGKYILRFEKL